MKSDRHFLHIFPNFGAGGMELRVTRIINGIGPSVRHTILALWGNYDAREYIDGSIRVDCPEPPARTRLLPYVSELRRIIRRHNPDLLLTYNWGAIDAVLGAWMSGFGPIIHHECGFGIEESVTLKSRRVLARRVLLRPTFAVAVTSRTLRDISIQRFKVPPDKVRWIRTGVDGERFRPGLSRDWRRQAGVRDDDLLFGSVGGLRPEKNLPLLLRAFAGARIPNAKLVLVGEGAERPLLEQLARDEGIAERVLLPGKVSDPAVCLGAFDVFALASCTEQTSNALLEAMACGLPAISTNVGDSRELLGDAGPPVIVPSGDLHAYTGALTALAQSPEFRARLGTANRQRCLQHYSLERMVGEYEALYAAACSGQPPSRTLS
jgi:glycosyltransferase involved in cell wall biosynthesis